MLKAPKTQTNSFAKWKFRNAEGILEALKEVMPEGCVTFANITVMNGVEMITETFTDGTGYITASMILPAIDPNHKGMSTEQMYGARLSYARKYVLGMLYAIDDSKDDPDTKEPMSSVPMPTRRV
jgi:hypothetical protein